jgi:hypothetical protein
LLNVENIFGPMRFRLIQVSLYIYIYIYIYIHTHTHTHKGIKYKTPLGPKRAPIRGSDVQYIWPPLLYSLGTYSTVTYFTRSRAYWPVVYMSLKLPIIGSRDKCLIYWCPNSPPPPRSRLVPTCFICNLLRALQNGDASLAGHRVA